MDGWMDGLILVCISLIDVCSYARPDIGFPYDMVFTWRGSEVLVL